MSIFKRKLAANRANAQKSTGATSPEGKAAVSQNAIKHGLTGRFKVLQGENPDWFDALFNQFMEDEKPVGSVEVELVRKMAEHTWLRERASRCQEACFLMNEQTPEQRKNGQAELVVRPDLERFLRYQAHHDRAYQRASKELRERRKERLKAEAGFVSQKHVEAEEERREKQQTQKDEIHFYRVATAKQRLERETTKTFVAAAAASKQLDGFSLPELAKMAA